jgi:tetratricopeptide (TPR) repeat protein
MAHSNLGIALSESGDRPGAIAAHREAIRLKPDAALAHTRLGNALHESGDLRGAIAAHREAIRLKPDLAMAHTNLGNALRESGDVRGAVAAYREAIRQKPDYAVAHYNLGNALSESGDRPGAIAAHREAIRQKPDYAMAHSNLGIALSESGDRPGAIAAHREAIRLKPDDAVAHTNLGLALSGSGEVRGAIAAYREAIRLKPDHAEAHCNLGLALRGQGQYAESLAELRVGHELGSKRPDWRYPSAAWVAEAERLAALAERLPAVLGGTDRPADAAERLAFAQMAYDTKRHAAAARLWAEALAADPKLSDDRRAQHRYNAACAAALAAAGRAEGEPPPDAAAKAELRRKALDWLRAELAAWSKVLDSGDPKADAFGARTLRHWRVDTDLAGVRDGDAIATLPADERRAWEALWKGVDALLKGEARPGPAGSKPDGAAPVRPGEVPAGSKPSTPPQGPPPPATPGPDVGPDALEALAGLRKRAHELAPSRPREAEPLFRRALEGYRKAQGPDGALTLDLTLDLANLLDQTGRGPEAEPLFRAGLEGVRKRFGADDPRTARILAARGLSLVRQGKWAEADAILRECLAIREKSQPDEWTTFNARSLLGGSLLGQKKYAEAEPLIVSGYEGMKAREARIPPPGRPRFAEGAERVIRFYEEWGQKDKAAEWRTRLAKPTDETENEP